MLSNLAMKKEQRQFAWIVFVLLALITLIHLQGCGGSDPKPQQKTQAQVNTEVLSSGQWSVQSVMVDGTDKTSLYESLKLTFTATTFTATHGGSVWPPSGTWQFTSDQGTTIHRGDGIDIDLDVINNNKVALRLTWSSTTIGPGREESISGQHIFTLGK